MQALIEAWVYAALTWILIDTTPGNICLPTLQTLAEIQIIYNLFPHMTEAYDMSDLMHFFPSLHVHVTVQICATWEEENGIKSLELCSVNPASHC